MARVDPGTAAARWAQGVSQNVNRYSEGVSRVNQAPGQAAAANVAGYQAGVAAGVQKWQRRVASVSLGDWQSAAINKGAPRLAQGAQASVGKMADFMGQLLPAVDSARSKVLSMPKLTLEDRINRSSTYQREMAKFQRR